MNATYSALLRAAAAMTQWSVAELAGVASRAEGGPGSTIMSIYRERSAVL
jgi:hypothetical protein